MCVCVGVCDVYVIDVQRDREGEREISESKIFAFHSLFLFVQEVDMETGEGTLLTIAARLPTAMLLLLPLLPMPPTVASRFVRALPSGLRLFFVFGLLQCCVRVSVLLPYCVCIFICMYVCMHVFMNIQYEGGAG